MRISFEDEKEYSITDEEGFYRNMDSDKEIITIERGPNYDEDTNQRLSLDAEAFWKLVEAAEVLKDED